MYAMYADFINFTTKLMIEWMKGINSLFLITL
jgi:hypothetical protein